MGNTNKVVTSTTPVPVHPHACGEHVTVDDDYIYVARFIPTLVGNTSLTAWGDLLVPVHPHACGEHLITFEILAA